MGLGGFFTTQKNILSYVCQTPEIISQFIKVFFSFNYDHEKKTFLIGEPQNQDFVVKG
jgi:hypothetical protein